MQVPAIFICAGGWKDEDVGKVAYGIWFCHLALSKIVTVDYL